MGISQSRPTCFIKSVNKVFEVRQMSNSSAALSGHSFACEDEFFWVSTKDKLWFRDEKFLRCRINWYNKAQDRLMTGATAFRHEDLLHDCVEYCGVKFGHQVSDGIGGIWILTSTHEDMCGRIRPFMTLFCPEDKNSVHFSLVCAEIKISGNDQDIELSDWKTVKKNCFRWYKVHLHAGYQPVMVKEKFRRNFRSKNCKIAASKFIIFAPKLSNPSSKSRNLHH